MIQEGTKPWSPLGVYGPLAQIEKTVEDQQDRGQWFGVQTTIAGAEVQARVEIG